MKISNYEHFKQVEQRLAALESETRTIRAWSDQLVAWLKGIFPIYFWIIPR